MCIITDSNTRYKAYDFYFEHPKQMADMELNMINDEIPHLINQPDRSVNHPVVRNYSYIPF